MLNELHARAGVTEIRYWRDTRHHEVDFIAVRRGRHPLAIECKWRVDGREDLSGLKAFRRAYPGGESLVVAPELDRPFERELMPDVRVRYVGLEEAVGTVGNVSRRGSG